MTSLYTASDPCDSNPCQNNGLCLTINNYNSYIRDCPYLKYGKNCESISWFLIHFNFIDIYLIQSNWVQLLKSYAQIYMLTQSIGWPLAFILSQQRVKSTNVSLAKLTINKLLRNIQQLIIIIFCPILIASDSCLSQLCLNSGTCMTSAWCW